MNTASASPAEGSVAAPGRRTVLVWDAPVRAFHWLMVLSFAGAYVTAESERWRVLHVTLGYTMAGLVAFRILWGLVGTRHARFASFVRGPKAIAAYCRALLRGRPEHHTGHNPAGAVGILALLGLTVAVALSGWATYNDVGGGWLEEAHELLGNAMLAVVGIHVAAVLLASWAHRENLVGAMLDGRKNVRPEEGVRRAWRIVAALMVAVVLGFWWTQWQGAPQAGNRADGPASAASRKHDRGHD